MAWKVKIPKFQPLTDLSNVLKKRRHEIAETFHKKALDTVLSNFDTDIPIEVVDSIDGKGNFIVEIRPKDNLFTNNRANGQEITTKQLFEWLNDGTDSNYAVMPNDFTNKSKPNSLETSRQTYAKHRIFLKPTSERGIEPRNWLELINEQYKAEDVTNIEKTIGNWLNNWTKK